MSLADPYLLIFDSSFINGEPFSGGIVRAVISDISIKAEIFSTIDPFDQLICKFYHQSNILGSVLDNKIK